MKYLALPTSMSSLILGRTLKCQKKWTKCLTGLQLQTTARGLFQVSSDQIPSLPPGGQIAVQTEHQLPDRAQVMAF